MTTLRIINPFKNRQIRKIFNFSNLLKLLFLYIFAILWVIFIEIDYSENFWTKAVSGNFSNKRFSFYSTYRIGEGVLYDRVLENSNRVGYDYSSFKFDEGLSQFAITKHFYYVSTSLVNYIFKPEFNLALTHHVNILPAGYNITYLNMPLDSLFNYKGEFLKYFSHLNDYDAYIDLYSFSNGSNEFLKNAIKKTGQHKPIIPLYLAQNKQIFTTLPRSKALITGSLWGCNRNSIRIAKALQKLAEEELLVAIGLKNSFDFLEKAYLGKMEDFGPLPIAIEQQHQKYGISLIIHNQEHMLSGIPTSRIAEAASVGSLIISDRNKFLTKFFGDSILYFDAFASDEEIYLQIKTHILWSQDNPEAALLKSRKAHDIFINNFTLKNQMEQLFLLVSKE